MGNFPIIFPSFLIQKWGRSISQVFSFENGEDPILGKNGKIWVIFQFFQWCCTHDTVGLMQMRGVNKAKEKSESADSVQNNSLSMVAVARKDLDWGLGHWRKTFSNVESFINWNTRNFPSETVFVCLWEERPFQSLWATCMGLCCLVSHSLVEIRSNLHQVWFLVICEICWWYFCAYKGSRNPVDNSNNLPDVSFECNVTCMLHIWALIFQINLLRNASCACNLIEFCSTTL